MADDGNYGGDDDGGLAEREAALKRCALVFFAYAVLLSHSSLEVATSLMRPWERKTEKTTSCAERERREKSE